ERAADQREHEILAELRREPVLDRGGAGALDHVALLAKIAGRHAGVSLDLPDALRHCLAACDQREDIAVDRSELGPERREARLHVIRHAPTLSRAVRDDDLAGAHDEAGFGAAIAAAYRQIARLEARAC